MCFSIFSQFWGGISSHSATARCTSEPEQYQSFSHLQDLLNSKMCWRWNVDRARRLLPATAGHTWPSPGGYSGWDGGGASHQFTLDLGEKALENIWLYTSLHPTFHFTVFLCTFVGLLLILFLFFPPHNAGGGDAWCMGILENITLIPRRDRGIIMPSVLYPATADNADCMNHPKCYTSGDCNEQLLLLQCSNSTVQYLS